MCWQRMIRISLQKIMTNPTIRTIASFDSPVVYLYYFTHPALSFILVTPLETYLF